MGNIVKLADPVNGQDEQVHFSGAAFDIQPVVLCPGIFPRGLTQVRDHFVPKSSGVQGTEDFIHALSADETCLTVSNSIVPWRQQRQMV